MTEYKICTKCREQKPADLTNFFRHAASPSGLTPRCKPCVNVDNAESHAKRLASDPEHIRKLGNARAKKHYHSNIEKSRKRGRESASRNRVDPEKRAAINMRKRAGAAGFTQAQFDELLSSQGGVCAICETDEPGRNTGSKSWNIDHCHVTGKVRFILCSPCNRGLAAFRDRPDVMRKAAELLEALQ